MSLVLDTHAVVWYLAKSRYISDKAFNRIEQTIARGLPVFVSAISIIEVIYLVEKNRLSPHCLEDLLQAVRKQSSGLIIAEITTEIAEMVEKVSRQTVPDMPDRIITATALHLGLPLVTRDAKIQAAGITSIW